MEQLQPASPGRRLGGNLLDSIPGLVLWLLFGLVFGSLNSLKGQILSWVINLIIFLYFWSKGSSPGKMVLGMRVYQKNGMPAGIGTMLLREFVGKLLSSLYLGIGYLWILFDQRHQCWHDKLAYTVVLMEKRQDITVTALPQPADE